MPSHVQRQTGTLQAPAWLVWLALWVVYLVWGSTYLAIRVAVRTLPPLLSGGARFLVAGAVMYAVLRSRRGPGHMAITPRQLASSAVIGAALIFGGNGLVTIAEQSVPSGLTALIIASVPLWVVVLRMLTGDRVDRGTLAGVLLGFAGVSLLVIPSGEAGGAVASGSLLIVVASLSWASGSFASRRLDLPADPFVSTTYQMLCGGLVLTLGGLLRGEAAGLDPSSFAPTSVIALGYLIVFGSLAAFTAYTWLLQNAPISKVATYAYVNPVVAVVLGWAILSEEITSAIVLGAILIVSSVAFTVRRESDAERGAVEEPPPAAAAVEAERA
ncbi:MAG: EamA family transporter [Actinomycetota bacterium]